MQDVNFSLLMYPLSETFKGMCSTKVRIKIEGNGGGK